MNVFGRNAAVAARALTGHSALAWHVESELVVHLTLLGVGKNFVGFLDLLKFFFGGFVAGIQVGMIFARQLAVGCADVLHRGFARHTQQFVVIGFRCGGH